MSVLIIAKAKGLSRTTSFTSLCSGANAALSIVMAVTAAASVPISSTEIYVLCIISVMNKFSAIPSKFAALGLNASFMPNWCNAPKRLVSYSTLNLGSPTFTSYL